MSRAALRAMARAVFPALPCKGLVADLCHGYLSWLRNENEPRGSANGEHRFARRVLGCSGPCTVFDVGANTGAYARYLLSVAPEIDLHCFEPSQATFEALRSSGIEGRARLNPFGLGDVEGVLTLYIHEDGCESNTLHHDGRPLRQEQVRIRTVDSYCAEAGVTHIRFLKIDVEGHELAVLRGSTRMLRERAVDTIQFEYSPSYIHARVFLADVFSLLVDSGYAVYRVGRKGLHPIPSYRTDLETLTYSNFAALPRGASASDLGISR